MIHDFIFTSAVVTPIRVARVYIHIYLVLNFFSHLANDIISRYNHETRAFCVWKIQHTFKPKDNKMLQNNFFNLIEKYINFQKLTRIIGKAYKH